MQRPHHNMALEHFLPSGPFAQLPMCASPDAEEGGAPNVSAIVWTERTPIAQRMLTLDDARLRREIARRLGDHLGAVHVVGRRWSYPLVAHARTPLFRTRGSCWWAMRRTPSTRSPARDSTSASAT